MVRKAQPAFAEIDDDSADEVLEVEEQLVVDDLKSARIKGTLNLLWGATVYDFEDGKKYRIPVDLYEYLRGYGNIYDTLA